LVEPERVPVDIAATVDAETIDLETGSRSQVKSIVDAVVALAPVAFVAITEWHEV
jgi:hypothetical protein